jgi:hypothetical protein
MSRIFLQRKTRSWAVAAVFAGVVSAGHAQVTDAVSVAYMQGQAPVAPDAIATLGPNLFGDSINLFTGSLSLEQTDFSLPGNNGLPVALVRSHSPGRSSQIRGAAADWDLNTPRIEGTFAVSKGWVAGYGNASTRCSSYDTPPTVTSGGGASAATDFFPWEYGAGVNIAVPGAGSQEVLRRAAGNSMALTDANSYPMVTAKNWQIGCLPSIKNGAGQGFTAIAPDGVRYCFDWMASRAVPLLSKGGTAITRQNMYLMATQVTDRFGNWVKYTYDAAKPLNLTKIESSDGRVATLSYSSDRLSSATDGTRTWSYGYDSNGDLHNVMLPDNSAWTFNLRALVPIYEVYGDGYVDCDSLPASANGGGTGTIVHPSGATGTFTLAPMWQGRTNATRACTYDNASGWTTGSMYPKSTTNVGMVSKQISGPGMPTMTWSYSGGSNDPNGEWVPCNNCAESKAVTVTEPSGAMTRHTFGIKWQVNEGQLLRIEEGWDGSTALKTTDYTYRGAAGQAFADRFGDSVYFLTDYLSTRNRPQDSGVIQQQGATFAWAAASGVIGFDSRARPLTVTKSSSLGYSRTETTSYADNLALWVLGQTAAVNEATTGKAIRASSYSAATAMPTAISTFGLQTHTFSYYSDGTLQTLTDAGGRATTFQNFTRGKPQGAVFADSSTASAVVNNLGNVALFTNEVSSSMSYGFDAMGRVSQIKGQLGVRSCLLPTPTPKSNLPNPEPPPWLAHSASSSPVPRTTSPPEVIVANPSTVTTPTDWRSCRSLARRWTASEPRCWRTA